ncbi:MAG: hypothetical protein KDC66_20185, partial [Phaeodactylibacter sp.]|nr:hypothetical protein [Phaeodactylibacter sp.]
HSEQLRRDLSVAYYKMGLILSQNGQEEQADVYFLKDMDLCEQLYHSNHNKIQYAEDLAIAYENMAQRQAKEKESGIAFQKKAVHIWRELYANTGHKPFLEKAERAENSDPSIH